MPSLTAATTISVERRKVAAPGTSAARRSTPEQSVTIGQPIEKVIALVGDASWLGDRVFAAADPTFRELRVCLGRQVEVRYTLYAIPGGTQVTAVARERGRSPWSIATPATRAVRRKIEADLTRLKDHLE